MSLDDNGKSLIYQLGAVWPRTIFFIRKRRLAGQFHHDARGVDHG
jgi:hypothetical protein